MGDWLTRMEKLGAVWRHDGNSNRPYALLTSGRIADCYCDCSKVTEHPNVLEEMVKNLRYEARKAGIRSCDVVVGPASGAITLAYEIARQLKVRAWFTEPVEEEKTQQLKRFGTDCKAKPLSVIIAEDVISTGGSTRKTIVAMRNAVPEVRIHGIMSLANFTGSCNLDEYPIVSLIHITVHRWERGKNPYTSDGRERVEPLRPKQNWQALTTVYA